MNSKFNEIRKSLESQLLERNDAIHALFVAVLSNQNMVILGPPGTGKSFLIQKFLDHFVVNGKNEEPLKKFELLVTKTTTVDEVLGPISLKGLENDKYYRVTTDRLPEAHLANLEELFKGSSSILNGLLTILQERVFYNNGKKKQIPLMSLIASSNEIPSDDDGLEALYDRFTIKVITNPIQERSNLLKLLSLESVKNVAKITLEDITKSREVIKTIPFGVGVKESFVDLISHIRDLGIYSSDRTLKAAMAALQAEAFLNGHEQVEESDFDCLRFVLWSDPKDVKRVSKKIIETVDPMIGRIIEAYENALSVVEKVQSEKKNAEKMNKSVEAVAKLKAIKKEIHGYISEMQKVNKDTKEVIKYELKIQDLFTNMLSEQFGKAIDDIEGL